MNKKLLVSLFFMQSIVVTTSYSDEADASETNRTTNANQVFSEHSNRFHVRGQRLSDPEIESTKNESVITKRTEHGKVQLAVGVKNVDFASQCEAQREKTRKNKDSKKKSSDSKESHAPKAEVTIRWSTDD